MRILIGILGIPLALAGCIRASIVEADGPRVTYAWSKADTSLGRVYSLATSYCSGWNAPPKLITDQIDGEQHTSTFKCVARPTLPFGQTPPGRLLNKL
jgi:hypothetical protein